ncbi:hypothetical protein JI76_18215 [Streptomyces anulatus]|uniref:hypothetical protein n=1 Tax=Streptomyces anulatus TaxID=1892 RepID=UPI0006DB6946|nr:hypothetical protein [Streptomyces anulatus]KPL31135.1 hypothetical protein JI76_18215 [Streptomyces anulatus]
MTTRLQHLARRLVDGARILTRRQARRIAAWIRAGRRDDLTGLAAALGCIARALIVAAGAYLLWRVIRAAPALLWVLVPAWCWAALRAAPRTATEHPPEEAPEEPEQSPGSTPEEVYDATLEWIHQQIAQRNGIHLSELLSHAQAHGLFAGLDLPNFRATLERWHIPVRQQLKVGGRNRPGIHREDLPPRPARGASPGPAQEPLPTRPTAA